VVATERPGVADLLVRCLEHEGVTVVFGIPGEENIRFTDALARSPIRYVLVRQADISITLDALAAATARRWQPGACGGEDPRAAGRRAGTRRGR
jgi:thiamine pyrophosphate-dependent acetolactate synthase large subunit-like protein